MRDDVLRKEPFDAQPAEPTDWDALRNMRDEDIDTSDIPVVVYEQYPLPGTMLRPIKQQVTMRLDVAVIDWFKAHATDSYQAYINRVLRHFTWQETGVFPTRPSVSVPVRNGRPRREAPQLQAAGVAEGPAPYAATGEERAPCACGCGEFPKGEGSTYLPGHDTRMYRIQDLIHTMAQSDSQWLQGIAQSHKDRAAARERGGPCICGCGETPSGKRSRFIIGHDARYRGFLLAELRAEGA